MYRGASATQHVNLNLHFGMVKQVKSLDCVKIGDETLYLYDMMTQVGRMIQWKMKVI